MISRLVKLYSAWASYLRLLAITVMPRVATMHLWKSAVQLVVTRNLKVRHFIKLDAFMLRIATIEKLFKIGELASASIEKVG
jgi:hypothetical protein